VKELIYRGKSGFIAIGLQAETTAERAAFVAAGITRERAEILYELERPTSARFGSPAELRMLAHVLTTMATRMESLQLAPAAEGMDAPIAPPG